jgi:hypothetical protein
MFRNRVTMPLLAVFGRFLCRCMHRFEVIFRFGNSNESLYRVKWVPCHHSMARFPVVEGDGLQICRVAASILNKQLWTADGGCPSNLGIGGDKPPLTVKTLNLLLSVQ